MGCSAPARSSVCEERKKAALGGTSFRGILAMVSTPYSSVPVVQSFDAGRLCQLNPGSRHGELPNDPQELAHIAT